MLGIVLRLGIQQYRAGASKKTIPVLMESHLMGTQMITK